MTEQQTQPPRKRAAFLGLGAGVFAIVVGVAVAMGVANKPKDKGEPVTAAADQVAPQPAPTAPQLAFKESYLEFNATFPDAGPSDPVIAALRKDADAYLEKMKADAKAAFDEAKKSGAGGLFPWSVDITWEYTAKTGGVVSLSGVSEEFEGGAHPIQKYDTYTARTTGEKLEVKDMFVLQKSPSPALMIAICEALKVEKKSRTDSETIYDEPIVCAGPKANAHTEEAKLALAPSDQPGKFGGVYAYYDPYVVGPYVEGSYLVSVQQKIFAEDLKPEFKPLFGGEAPSLEN